MRIEVEEETDVCVIHVTGHFLQSSLLLSWHVLIYIYTDVTTSTHKAAKRVQNADCPAQSSSTNTITLPANGFLNGSSMDTC